MCYNINVIKEGVIMKKAIHIIGIIIFCLGLMSGNSENLLYPLGMLVIGYTMAKVGAH